MSDKSYLNTYKKNLKAKETNFKQLLSIESDEFESDFFDKIKKVGYITGGLLSGYIVYRMVAPKEEKKPSPTSKKNEKKQSAEKINVTVKDKLTAFAIQLAISFISEKLKNNISDERDSSTTKS